MKGVINIDKNLDKKRNISELIFQISLVCHFIFGVFFLFFMFFMVVIDDYLGLLSVYILRIVIITFIIGIILISIKTERKIITLFTYIICILFINFTFLISSSFIRDMPAYFEDNYESTSGTITKVHFKSSKTGEPYVDKIYINDEAYHINMQTITKSYFNENWEINEYVTIEYLKNSKEIVTIG